MRKQIAVVIDGTLHQRFVALCGKLGTSFASELQRAMQRHLDNPPRRIETPHDTPPPARPAATAPPPARATLASVPGLKRGTELPARKKREETPEEPIVVRVVPDDDGPTVNAE